MAQICWKVIYYIEGNLDIMHEFTIIHQDKQTFHALSTKNVAELKKHHVQH